MFRKEYEEEFTLTLNGINLAGWKDSADKQTKKAASAKDVFCRIDSANADEKKGSMRKKERIQDISEHTENSQNETGMVTQVLVKPDGSRVLLVRVLAAGMETTMSLKLSEETDLPNHSTETAGNVKEQHTNVAELPNQIDSEMK